MQMSGRPTTAGRLPSCAVSASAWPAGPAYNLANMCTLASLLEDALGICFATSQLLDAADAFVIGWTYLDIHPVATCLILLTSDSTLKSVQLLAEQLQVKHKDHFSTILQAHLQDLPANV